MTIKPVGGAARTVPMPAGVSAYNVENVGFNLLGEHPGSIEPELSTVRFLPETLSGMEILEQLRAKTGRMVLVVDEYGVVQGLLTPRDLLEAIIGELQPSLQEDAWATRLDDGSWLLDGLMPVGELKARLEIDDLPGEERGRYNTVAGLLMAVSGRLPDVADQVSVAGWDFQVVDLDGRRIDRVMARKHSTSAPPADLDAKPL